jgi:hypothetical protein
MAQPRWAQLLPLHWYEWVAFFLSALQPRSVPAIRGIDGFAGQKEIAKAFLDAKLPMVPFEMMDDPVTENCLSLEGQQYFLQTLVRTSLTPYGFCWLGPPCSWWVWVSRSVHQRSMTNPLGNTTHPSVGFHNVLAEFVANVIWTCAALGIFYVLEQPLSSILVHHPQVKAALQGTQARCIRIPLYKFGAATRKPLQLWGTAPWLTELRRIADSIHVPVPGTALCTVGNQGQVTGKKQDMTASAAYPVCFCKVVAFLHKSFLASKAAEAESVHMFVRSQPKLQHQWFTEALLAFLFPTAPAPNLLS